MATMIFVNLAVKDLERSKRFWTDLGYAFNPQFTDDNAACLVISDTIYAMLLTERFFNTFTPRKIADTATTAEVILALSVESREAVDQVVERAMKIGGTKAYEPQDLGFMYSRSINDPDGHIWEFVWMDPANIQ
jgi:predicted lactoylglutathione lyase